MGQLIVNKVAPNEKFRTELSQPSDGQNQWEFEL
jgi:hypothetical protein